MNLKHLPDDTLLHEIQRLVQQEREVLGQILHHLREIEKRKLFSKLKLGSLYEYATKSLGYSDDQAYRRIQAMRLLKELPEIEEKINDGSLNLTHLGMAQSLFKREAKANENYTKLEKLEILEKFENTTKREAERVAISFSSIPHIPVEKIRTVSAEDVEIKFTAKETLLKKIQKLKALVAHKNPNIQLSELIDQLCDLGLEQWDKSSAPVRKIQGQTPSQAQVKREVWKRDKGECQNCGSQFAVEIDHIFPKALGGEDNFENLRLLCRSCNQRQAINVFGVQKMENYLEAT